MSLTVRALLYQLACFAVLFITARLLLDLYSRLQGFWIPFTAFMISTILAPKFRAVRTPDGEKLYMRWIFLKGTREIM